MNYGFSGLYLVQGESRVGLESTPLYAYWSDYIHKWHAIMWHALAQPLPGQETTAAQ